MEIIYRDLAGVMRNTQTPVYKSSPLHPINKLLLKNYSISLNFCMNKAYWNEIASSYEDEIFSVFHEDRNKILLSYFDKYANPSHFAVDFGCGIGKAFGYLAPRFRNVLAVDFAQNLLDTAKLNAPSNISIRRFDLTKKGLKLPQADFGFCCNVVMMPDIEKNYTIISNIRNALKPGGAAIFILPSLESMISKSWITAEWFRRDGVAFEEIPRSQWNDFKYGKKSFLLGLIDINGVTTKHYLRSEIKLMFNSAGLDVKGIERLEYDWNTEFESPPEWMHESYPWDWLVECERMN